MSTELARVETQAIAGINDALQPDTLVRQVALIQQVMSSVMKSGEHYGVIPGTSGKPSLLKPGAEKLAMTFRFSPAYDVEVINLMSPVGAAEGHREYRIKCTLTHMPSGLTIGEGVGSASTLESKWRFRSGPTTITDKPVPKEYWDTRKTDPAKAQEIIGGKGYQAKKDDSGKWMIAEKGERAENDNPADVYNTCLKVGKKRAMVDAVLSSTAASDCFTQDIEELQENGVIQSPPQEKKQEEKKASSVKSNGEQNSNAPTPAPDTAAPNKSSKTDEEKRSYIQGVAEKFAAYSRISVPEAVFALSKFAGKDGKDIGKENVSQLSGRWLNTVYSKAKEAEKEMESPSEATTSTNDDEYDDVPF